MNVPVMRNNLFHFRTCVILRTTFVLTVPLGEAFPQLQLPHSSFFLVSHVFMPPPITFHVFCSDYVDWPMSPKLGTSPRDFTYPEAGTGSAGRVAALSPAWRFLLINQQSFKQRWQKSAATKPQTVAGRRLGGELGQPQLGNARSRIVTLSWVILIWKWRH